jgi:hypothetical protein
LGKKIKLIAEQTKEKAPTLYSLAPFISAAAKKSVQFPAKGPVSILVKEKETLLLLGVSF